MTGRTVTTMHWRALDREGDDKCRLARTDHGWILVGHARFRDMNGFAALDYIVRCNEDWQTLSVDVAGEHGPLTVSIQIVNNAGSWLLNEELQAEVEGAGDIDLAFTPATNLMPLRRLLALEGVGLSVQAARLDYPKTVLRPLDQVYNRTRANGIVSYRAAQTGFETQLSVDGSGFVIRYPDLWEGEVNHAPD